jgi:hypothetical protein
VQLQLGPEVRLVGLTQAEARKTMGLRPFREGITLARAYDLHRLKYVVVILCAVCAVCRVVRAHLDVVSCGARAASGCRRSTST